MAAQARTKVKTLIDEDKLDEAQNLAEAQIANFRGSDKAGTCELLLAAADVAQAKNQSGKMLKAAREAWPLAKELKDNKLIGEALLSMFNGLMLSGDAKMALKSSTSALQAVKEAGPALEANYLHAMAGAHLKLHDAEDALEVETKAMALFKQAKDKQGEAKSLATTAKALRMLGRFDDAIAKAKESADFFRPLGQAAGIVAAVETIIDAEAAMGRPQVALATAEKELDLLRKASADKKNELIMLEKVAQVANDQGQKLQVASRMEEMIEVCKKAGDSKGEATRTLAAARSNVELGHSQDALRLAKSAQSLFQALGDAEAAEECKKLQTDIFVKKGQHGKAPHRAEALTALKSFIRSVEQREIDQVAQFETDLNKANSAIKDSEMSTALESLFERDPDSLGFLEKQGWDLESFKSPTTIYQYPHQAFYLANIAGGMNFGPQFRSVYPYRKDRPSNVEALRMMAVCQLPDAEAWMGAVQYRHGIMDAGLQSTGTAGYPPS